MVKDPTIPLAIVLSLFTTSKGQHLTAVYCNATLHTPLSDHSIWYDGDDFVFIFGGGFNHPTGNPEAYQIHRYSLDKDIIEFVGTLPGKAFFGYTNSDNSGNIFYFGGQDAASKYYNEVYKFNPVANTSELVAIYSEHSLEIDPVTFKQNSSSNTITFSKMLSSSNQTKWYWGYEDFDMVSFTFKERQIPAANDLPASAFVKFNETTGYIFYGLYLLSQIWELNIQTLEMTQLNGSWFPSHYDNDPKAVTDGENIFIVGAFYDDDHPEINAEGIIKFSPASRDISFLPVDNWPIKDRLFSAPQTVYISKLNRIYCFGGFEYGFIGEMDLIWYVDLNPPPSTQTPTSSSTSLPTTTFDPQFCSGKPNDFYPHPTNCSIFVSCWDEVSLEFSCPDGFLYNTTLQTCSPFDEVDCEH